MQLQEPKRFVLKERSMQTLSGRVRKVVVKKEKFMYIPLLQSLQCLLNNATIIQEVCKYIKFECDQIFMIKIKRYFRYNCIILYIGQW